VAVGGRAAVRLACGVATLGAVVAGGGLGDATGLTSGVDGRCGSAGNGDTGPGPQATDTTSSPAVTAA
jgi:hypothetical protein